MATETRRRSHRSADAEQKAVLAPPVDEQVLSEVVRRIVAEADPEQIILFGSYAYGTPHEDSDIDLLVITSNPESPRQQGVAILLALQPSLVPIDVLVRTPEKIAYRLQIGDPFMREILERGRTLYVRDDSADHP